jgi:hypothetical protein
LKSTQSLVGFENAAQGFYLIIAHRVVADIEGVDVFFASEAEHAGQEASFLLLIQNFNDIRVLFIVELVFIDDFIEMLEIFYEIMRFFLLA